MFTEQSYPSARMIGGVIAVIGVLLINTIRHSDYTGGVDCSCFITVGAFYLCGCCTGDGYMKLKTPYKTVMFYGNALRINVNANWLAVDKDGTITAFADEPCVIGSVWM